MHQKARNPQFTFANWGFQLSSGGRIRTYDLWVCSRNQQLALLALAVQKWLVEGTAYFFSPQDRTPAYPIAVMPSCGHDRIAKPASNKQNIAPTQTIMLD